MKKVKESSLWVFDPLAAIIAVLLFSVMMTTSIIRMDRAQKGNGQSGALRHELCGKAHLGHLGELQASPRRTAGTDTIGQISLASSEESAAVSAELFQEVRSLESTTGRFRLKSGGGRGRSSLNRGFEI